MNYTDQYTHEFIIILKKKNILESSCLKPVNSFVLQGSSAPWSNPYPFIYHFGRKGAPVIPFIEKRFPFHIPTLGSLVLMFM